MSRQFARLLAKVVGVSLLITMLFVFASASLRAEDEEIKKGTFKVDLKTGHYMCHVPQCYKPDGKSGIILILHGRGGNGANMINAFVSGSELDNMNWIGVAPKSPGVMWEAGDKHAMESLNDALSKYKVDKNRIHIAGFSAGGLFAGWLGFSKFEMFRTIVVMGANLGQGSIGKVKKDPDKPIYLVNGETCRFADGAISDFKSMERMGAKNVRLKILKGEGHSFNIVKVLPTIFEWYKAMESGFDYFTALKNAMKYASKKKLKKAIAIVAEIEKHPREEVFWQRLAKVKEEINTRAEKKLKSLLSRIKRKKPKDAIKALKEFEKDYAGYPIVEKAACARADFEKKLEEESEEKQK